LLTGVVRVGGPLRLALTRDEAELIQQFEGAGVSDTRITGAGERIVTLAAGSAAAILSALLIQTIGLADALAALACVLGAGANAAGATAAVVAALAVGAVGQTQAQPVGAHLLGAGAFTTNASAAVAAALLSFTVGSIIAARTAKAKGAHSALLAVDNRGPASLAGSGLARFARIGRVQPVLGYALLLRQAV